MFYKQQCIESNKTMRVKYELKNLNYTQEKTAILYEAVIQISIKTQCS